MIECAQDEFCATGACGTQRRPNDSNTPCPVNDAQECGRICYEAFRVIAAEHNFPADFPVPEIAIGILTLMFSHAGFYGVVAEDGRKILGSNCLDERTPIAGVGPVAVNPAAQNQQTGRRLMEAVMQRAAEKKFARVRLVQDREWLWALKSTPSSRRREQPGTGGWALESNSTGQP